MTTALVVVSAFAAIGWGIVIAFIARHKCGGLVPPEVSRPLEFKMRHGYGPRDVRAFNPGQKPPVVH